MESNNADFGFIFRVVIVIIHFGVVEQWLVGHVGLFSAVQGVRFHITVRPFRRRVS